MHNSAQLFFCRLKLFFLIYIIIISHILNFILLALKNGEEKKMLKANL